MVGNLLQHGVVQITASHTQHGKKNTAFALFLDQFHQFIHIGNADIKVPVSAEDDAVITAFDEVCLSNFVGSQNAGRSGRGATRAELAKWLFLMVALSDPGVEGRARPAEPA